LEGAATGGLEPRLALRGAGAGEQEAGDSIRGLVVARPDSGSSSGPLQVIATGAAEAPLESSRTAMNVPVRLIAFRHRREAGVIRRWATALGAPHHLNQIDRLRSSLLIELTQHCQNRLLLQLRLDFVEEFRSTVLA
jgi:hypothetical protein